MEKTLENITETIKENSKSFFELFRERLYSPMYFYFIISWVLFNWEFVYVFLFGEEQNILVYKNILKIEFLQTLYGFSSFENGFYTIGKLFLFPAISSFVAVWWLTIVSSSFYEKYEKFKQNKRVIDRKLEYEEKVTLANEQRKIRDAEADKNKVRYEDNDEFNQMIDDTTEEVSISGIYMRPSEILYNNDYEAYVEELNNWKTDEENYKKQLNEYKKENINNIKDKYGKEIVDEYFEEKKGEQQFEEMRDR